MKSGSHNEIGVVGAGGCGQDKCVGPEGATGRTRRANAGP